MKLNQGMRVKLGTIEGTIFGGPFRNYEPGTRRLVGVKMAAEINHPHEISIPTEDFSIPDVLDMQRGLEDAVRALYHGNDIYAGCMGGIGRTGLFMGCMAKLMDDLGENIGDPVAYVRSSYKLHAIETQEQQDFVRGFDTSSAVQVVKSLTDPKVNTVYVEVEKEVYPSLWAWLKWFFIGIR